MESRLPCPERSRTSGGDADCLNRQHSTSPCVVVLRKDMTSATAPRVSRRTASQIDDVIAVAPLWLRNIGLA